MDKHTMQRRRLLAGMVAITGGLSTLLLVRIVRSVRRRGAAART